MQYKQHIESESFITQSNCRPGGPELTLRGGHLNKERSGR